MARTDNASTRLDADERADLEELKAQLAATGLTVTDSDALRWLIRDWKRRHDAAVRNDQIADDWSRRQEAQKTEAQK